MPQMFKAYTTYDKCQHMKNKPLIGTIRNSAVRRKETADKRKECIANCVFFFKVAYNLAFNTACIGH